MPRPRKIVVEQDRRGNIVHAYEKRTGYTVNFEFVNVPTGPGKR